MTALATVAVVPLWLLVALGWCAVALPLLAWEQVTA